jgi:hypothetical protein
MLSRKNHETLGQPLPAEWIERVQNLMEDLYRGKCEKLQRTFAIYGFHYPDELLLIVSLLGKNNPRALPVSCFLSIDLEQEGVWSGQLETLLDGAGMFFDSFFAKKDWNDYLPDWTKATFRKKTIYYMVSRENIALTIEADRLLKK